VVPFFLRGNVQDLKTTKASLPYWTGCMPNDLAVAKQRARIAGLRVSFQDILRDTHGNFREEKIAGL